MPPRPAPALERSEGTRDPRPRKRGGQPGNVNALRTGRRSPRLRALVEALIAQPESRALILRVARIQQTGVLQQLEDAAYLRIARRVRALDNLHLDMGRYLHAVDRRSDKKRRSNSESRAL